MPIQLSRELHDYYTSLEQQIRSAPMSGAQVKDLIARIKQLPTNLPITGGALAQISKDAELPSHYQGAIAFALLLHRHGDKIKDALAGDQIADMLAGLRRDAPKDEKIAEALAEFHAQILVQPTALDKHGINPFTGPTATRPIEGGLELGDPHFQQPLGKITLDKEGALIFTAAGEGKPVKTPVTRFSVEALAILYDAIKIGIHQQPNAHKALTEGTGLVDFAAEAMREAGQVLNEKHTARNAALVAAEAKLREVLKDLRVGKVEREAMEAMRAEFGISVVAAN